MPTPKRIVVIRLDRLGDVVLSLPVVQELRKHFPDVYIAMMVRPACVDVVRGHPAIDEVLVYDKDGLHRSLRATIRFARTVRKAQFDTAIILHPTNRSHCVAWLAGIPMRIGYRRKCGWLLTYRLPHRKQEGAYHESLYSLELLRPLGIEAQDPQPFVAIQPEAVHRVEARLTEVGISPTDTIVAVHPSSSSISKRWMPERFAAVADQLATAHGVRICIVAGAESESVRSAQEMAGAMTQPVLNLAGQLSIAESAALLKRSRLLISNDSGPVHLAAAVGTPVVAIFGRNQRGLSQRRWGPRGKGHVVLQKDVGCVTCLADQCDIEFLCLTSLHVEEVYRAAVSILTSTRLTG